jgi:NAD+ diphosphatase
VAPDTPLILLGLLDGRVRFATPASDDTPPVEGARFADARESGALLPGHEAAALAMARGLLLWHEATRFCPRCGAPVRLEQAGHLLRCTSEGCGTTHHARIEPSIITLVTDGGERCILGRSRRHPPGMHSCFAGFVEPGESLEDAVVREVREEIGVGVVDVEYHSSQPWPFPAALMIGFIARTDDAEIRMEDGDGEILEARWFTRAELLASPEDDTLRLPRASSIARRMVEDWLRGQA